MKAGRELDALVAEWVMGWEVNWVDPAFRDGIPHYYDKGNRTLLLHDQWNPSLDISDAWQVVEKLSREGNEHPACIQKGLPAFGDHATSFEVYKNYAGYPGWTCYFHDYEICAYADTVPLAICLAALKVCGTKAEE